MFEPKNPFEATAAEVREAASKIAHHAADALQDQVIPASGHFIRAQFHARENPGPEGEALVLEARALLSAITYLVLTADPDDHIARYAAGNIDIWDEHKEQND